MGLFSIFWILSWLLESLVGRLILVLAVLWYVDQRWLGWLAALWQPILRAQRIGNLRHAVEVNPSDVRAMVELGEHYLRAGKPAVAAEYLERAIARGEDGARALYLLGAAQVKLGQYKEGRQRLEAAVAATPQIGYGEPYVYLLEECFATEGAQAQRVRDLVRAFETFEGVEVLTRAGRLCAAAGRKDLAQELFGEAVRNYGFVPKRMRRKERRWALRARIGQLQAK